VVSHILFYFILKRNCNEQKCLAWQIFFKKITAVSEGFGMWCLKMDVSNFAVLNSKSKTRVAKD